MHIELYQEFNYFDCTTTTLSRTSISKDGGGDPVSFSSTTLNKHDMTGQKVCFVLVQRNVLYKDYKSRFRTGRMVRGV